MNELGVYVHIPFCKSKCAYCDFYSLANCQALMDPYVKALCAHFRESARFDKKYTVDTVYFGGGTPSLLGARRLKRLIKELMKDFTVSRTAEITIEANPDSADRRTLKRLRRAGFNRLSLGMQSHDNDILREIGRVHTFEDVCAAVENARRAGFSNISLDIIYGLPGQTLENWNETLAKAIALNPEHLSCYGLKLEEHTPLFEMRESLDIPGEDMQACMYMAGVEMLGQAGYEQYEISNYALPGFASRHNMKYWALEEYVGFGPGAHSDFAGLRYSYIKDLEGYIDGIATGGAIIDEKEEIPLAARADEYLMLGLRTVDGISTNKYMRSFHATSFEPIERVLESLIKYGYTQRAGDRWKLTPKGFLVSNQIIGKILDAASNCPAKKSAENDTDGGPGI